MTLGLGLNRVLVFIEDSPTTGDADGERRVLNVYTMTVYRQARFTPPSPTYSHRDTAADVPPPSMRACRLLQVSNNSAFYPHGVDK